MILDYLKNIKPELYKPNENLMVFVTDRPVNTSVDWFRATNTKLDRFNKFVGSFSPFLRGCGFSFLESDKKINGYSISWIIDWNGQNCGHICADDRMGGMIDISGTGCQVLQGRWDLWCYMHAELFDQGFTTKRLDVCMDLKGKVWDLYGLNMLHIARMVKDGLHNVPRGGALNTTLIGDWLDVVTDGLLPDDYVPVDDCLGGLTINVGSGQSVNKWVWYEKGKQLMGRNPERYDGSMNSWVRLERRFGTGSGNSKVVIPSHFAVRPDEAFVYNCSGVESFVSDWLDFQRSHGVVIEPAPKEGYQLERVEVSKKVDLKKTFDHVVSQSARLFRTLDVLGIDVAEFARRAMHENPVKGFDSQLYDGTTLDKLFGCLVAPDPAQFSLGILSDCSLDLSDELSYVGV